MKATYNYIPIRIELIFQRQHYYTHENLTLCVHRQTDESTNSSGSGLERSVGHCDGRKTMVDPVGT